MPQPLRARTGFGRGLGDRRVRPVQPPPGHGLAQRHLAREVPVDAAVADAERPGHVDHGRLGRPEPAQDVLRRFEDLLAGEYVGHQRSLSSICICGPA
ncbi:hypothetical protein GCM10029964_023700 [Kibdelosporangium lantanae]